MHVSLLVRLKLQLREVVKDCNDVSLHEMINLANAFRPSACGSDAISKDCYFAKMCSLRGRSSAGRDKAEVEG